MRVGLKTVVIVVLWPSVSHLGFDRKSMFKIPSSSGSQRTGRSNFKKSNVQLSYWWLKKGFRRLMPNT